tara:strand:+ start:1128 stop:1691 length:564 start_codon:yes stop_codon:yes gene_type:complete
MEVKIDAQVGLTEVAAKEVKKAAKDQGMSARIRVQVQGGGCSGFQYGLAFEEPDAFDEKNDVKFQEHDVDIVVDKKSLLYLDGTTIDFHEDLSQRGFAFDNPNATKSCGCGQSFQAHKWLDECCSDEGLTAEEVAERSGIDISRIKRMMARRWTPSPQDRSKISQIFNKKPDELVWGHEATVNHIYG